MSQNVQNQIVEKPPETEKEFIWKNILLKRSTGRHTSHNNGFGTICFEGFGRKESEPSEYARYVKVSSTEEIASTKEMEMDSTAQWRRNFDKECVGKVWELMTKYWKMPTPKLIISVTGGAKAFSMKKRLLANFKRGLMKAATSADAWIVTGGTKAGVMEIVGDAVRVHTMENKASKQRIVVLGVAVWGILTNKQELKDNNHEGRYPCRYSDPKSDDKTSLLDPNHTHFILVDSKQSKYGGEIGFRVALERFISENAIKADDSQGISHVPVVLLVLEGGQNTLKTAVEAIEAKTPVVVIAGSGRAADFIAYYFDKMRKLDEEKDVKAFHELLREEPVKRKLISSNYEKNSDKNKDIQTCIDYVITLYKNKTLVTIFQEEDIESDGGIDKAIIKSLFTADGTAAESQIRTQLKLALAYNSSDLAKDYIFNIDNLFKWKNEANYSELQTAMQRALIDDKPEFVRLFLDNGVDLKKFLDHNRLRTLYNEVLGDSSSITDVINHLIADQTQSWGDRLCCQRADISDASVSLRSIGDIINYLTSGQWPDLYKDSVIRNTGAKEIHDQQIKTNGVMVKASQAEPQHQDFDFDYPERELFLWALLLNRKELALIFWKCGQSHIGGALTASFLLQSLADYASGEEELDLAEKLANNAIEFEKLGVEVLNKCYNKNKEMSHELLVRDLDIWGDRTLFFLSNTAKQMEFMGNTCCQTKLNRNWLGKMALNTSMLTIFVCLFLPFLAVLLIKFTGNDFYEPEEDEDNPENNGKRRVEKKHKNKSKQKVSFIQAIYYFNVAPVVKFSYHTISYLIFLGIYSYFLLCDLYPYHASVTEYIAWAWVVSFWIEEFRQILEAEEPTFGLKLYYYYSSTWNKFDLLVNTFFVVSVILRLTLPESTFIWARMFYTVTLTLYFLRFLQIFYVSKRIGPKVIMIERMLTDLCFFLLLLSVFLFSFGIAAQSLMYPNAPPTWDVLLQVVYSPYFDIYGAGNTMTDLEGQVSPCSTNETIYSDSSLGIPRCPDQSWLANLMFAVYLLLVNILLINLLIAMFSYTFSRVQDNSEQVWRYYRYELIFEYFEKPALAPPLILISIVFRIFERCCCQSLEEQDLDTAFKCKFKPDVNDRLTAFERAGLEEYTFRQKLDAQEKMDSKLTNTGNRLEKVAQDVDYLKDQITSIQASTSATKTRLRNDETTTDFTQSSIRSETYLDQSAVQQKLSRLDEQMKEVVSMLQVLIASKPSITGKTSASENISATENVWATRQISAPEDRQIMAATPTPIQLYITDSDRGSTTSV